jgi:hypothetical protein
MKERENDRAWGATSLPTLLPVQQQCEIREAKEDWTGTTDPVQRRKLQNRLHQRAWSKTTLAMNVAVG